MVGSVFTAMTALSSAIDVFNNDSVQESLNKGKITLETQGSMTRLLAETIITPTIYVSKELEMHPDIDKIINFNIDIIASMVSRSFNMLVTLKGLKPSTAFDVINQKTISGGLQSDIKREERISASFRENKGFTFGKESVAGLQDDNKKDKGNDFSIPSIYQKEISLKIDSGKEGSKPVVIPLIIKARVEFIPAKALVDSLIDKTYEPTFMDRLLDVNAGLVPAKNLWIPVDLWKEYKAKLIKDDYDLLKRAEEKDSISLKKMLTTGGVKGLNNYLGALIITADELEDIEVRFLRGKVNNEAKKDTLLTNTRSSLLNVVDTSFNKLRILTKDNDGDTIMDIRSLKKKTEGNDINEIFKMLISGRGL